MDKYKILAVSQIFTQKGLINKANEQLNKYAEQGWEVVEMRKGWSGLFFSSLYFLLELKGNNLK